MPPRGRGRRRPRRSRSASTSPARVDGAVVRRAGAAQLLVQLAVRRLRDVRRPRHHVRGRPRAGRPRPRPVARRRRDRAVAQRPHASTSRGCSRRSPRSTASTSTRRGRSSRPSSRRWSCTAPERQGARSSTRTATAARASTRPTYEGVDPVAPAPPRATPRATAPREQYRGLHARGAVPGVRRRPAQAGVARRSPSTASNIAEVCDLSIGESAKFLAALELSERDRMIAERVHEGDQRPPRVPARRRARLPHAVAARPARSPAARRSASAWRQIGSGLVGVLYVLDEPSIGLHQRDNRRLIDTLIRLRDLGNTVLVVEHDEETIRERRLVVDIGPGAGEHGGEVVVRGPGQGAARRSRSRSPASTCRASESIPVPEHAPPAGRRVARRARAPASTTSRTSTSSIPLGCFVAVTGVSGLGQVDARQRHPAAGR